MAHTHSERHGQPGEAAIQGGEQPGRQPPQGLQRCAQTGRHGRAWGRLWRGDRDFLPSAKGKAKAHLTHPLGGRRKAEGGRRKAEGGRRKAEGGRGEGEGGRRRGEGGVVTVGRMERGGEGGGGGGRGGGGGGGGGGGRGGGGGGGRVGACVVVV